VGERFVEAVLVIPELRAFGVEITLSAIALGGIAIGQALQGIEDGSWSPVVP
jgi:hypothetical protein